MHVLPSSQPAPSFIGIFAQAALMHAPMLQASVNDVQSSANWQGPLLPELELCDELPPSPPPPCSPSVVTPEAHATGAAQPNEMARKT